MVFFHLFFFDTFNRSKPQSLHVRLTSYALLWGHARVMCGLPQLGTFFSLFRNRLIKFIILALVQKSFSLYYFILAQVCVCVGYSPGLWEAIQTDKSRAKIFTKTPFLFFHWSLSVKFRGGVKLSLRLLL